MEKLVKGFLKFRSEVFEAKKALFSKLSSQQSPRALFITCSDSRVDPTLLTQTDPGELFILRNAGNIVPPYGSMLGSSTATIEYAMAVLEVPNIIVCGHTDCAVMKALLNPESVQDLPAVRAWVAQGETTRRMMQDHHDHEDPDDRLLVATQENVRAQLDNLRTHPSVALQLRKGKVSLHGWVYSISTGDVWVYDFDTEQFVPLADRHSASA
ncbi:MAG: carbonic anhydrase [Candidatus Thiodiazotropha sp.]